SGTDTGFVNRYRSSRRGLIRGCPVWSAVVLAPSSRARDSTGDGACRKKLEPSSSKGSDMDQPRPIDIHAHYYPEPYLRLIAEHGGAFGASCALHGDRPVVEVGGLRAGPLEARFTDLDLRVAEMDRIGVDVHALSLTQPMVYWAGRDLAQRLAAAFNDSLAAANEAHPDRLVGLATLPMQEPELAVAELERVARLPGIRGIYVATRILDRELSHPAFLPVFERIEDLGIPVFLHPLNVIDPHRLRDFFLTNLLGNPFDTAIAAAHLIFGGVLDRFPRLEFCLPHAGGAFPYLIGRLHHGWKVRPECRHLAKGPMDYLRRFTYDTIAHSDDALAYLIRTVGADRVMLGSDYCFDMGIERPVEAITRQPDLARHDKDRILGGTARRLLKL
ncbi:MAG: amidohydrolase family protein, partial [Geminicoccaceae bacterium]